MDCVKMNADAAEEGGCENDIFFIGDLSSSEDELDIFFSHKKRRSSPVKAAPLSRANSPPLLLAFNLTSRQKVKDCSLSSPSSSDSQGKQQEEEEGSDQSIEEWMILGGGAQMGDSSIQLNLSYCSTSEDESADGDEDCNVKSVNNTWAVSEKDKYDAEQSLSMRYFVPGNCLLCNICNRMGHLGRSCYYNKKCPTCILCGIQGHIQRDCPNRPCPSCGLPSHGLRPCERPPLWNQHCQRCGTAGHLSDTCPDTWRQYHLTIRLEVPLQPRMDHKLKRKKSSCYCYNCSERGHYGYECTKRRMISGTSPSVPYVCHYDTTEDLLQHRKTMQKSVKELLSAGRLSDQQPSELTKESVMESQTVKGGSRLKHNTWGRAGRRKTWPERRRERREVKRLRREAQARREGMLLETSQENFDFEDTDSFRSPLQSHRQSTHWQPEGGRRTRQTEKWKKEGEQNVETYILTVT